MGKVNLFYDPQVDIEGGTICWENRTCFINTISQIWVGKPNEGKWGWMTDTESEGLNLELNSGCVNAFLSEDHDFLMQAYELLCGIVDQGRSKGKNTIDFENRSLQVYEEPEEEIEELQPAPVPVFTGSSLIRQQLLDLMEHCKKKETVGTAVIQLLEEIIASYDSGKDVKELYKIFIQLSLINDCNELGLNALIEEVKAHVYHI